MSETPIQKIGRYEIEREIGRGGMAIVYKAHEPHLNRDVAIKLIRKGAFSGDQLETLPERFKREAWALARLNHPNIVQVYDYGYYEDMPYLVMEYLEGVTLKEVKKPLKVASAVRLLRPIAEAIDYVHSQGMLHRDIKPSNIMITRDEKIRLTDFGIAKFLDDSPDQHTLTGTGVGIGTPEYMAPEQGLGRTVDARSDQYALSVVFYELITGRKPFTGDTPVAILTRQAIEPFPDPRQFVPHLSESVKRFFDRALAKNPDDRYEKMSDYLRDLDGLRLQSMSAKAGGTTVSSSVRKENAEGEGAVTGSSVRVGMDALRKVRAAAGKAGSTEKTDAASSAKRIPWKALTFVSVTIAALIGGFFGSRGLMPPRSNEPGATFETTAESGTATFDSTLNLAILLTQEAETARVPEPTQGVTPTILFNQIISPSETPLPPSTEMILSATPTNTLNPTATTTMTLTIPAAISFGDVQVGDLIEFGRYEQDNILENEPEPIVWQALEVTDDSLLLISKYGLACRPFTKGREEGMSWENSDLRAWLNYEFMPIAFDSSERYLLKTKHLTNTRGSNDTDDMVFLLSDIEVDKYFPKIGERQIKLTKVATSEQDGNTEIWWLRSRDNSSFWNNFMSVLSSGLIDTRGQTGYPFRSQPVRPVIEVYRNAESRLGGVSDSDIKATEVAFEKTKTVVGLGNGETFEFGRYEQDNFLGNGPEPIEWKVLNIEDGIATLISVYGLDSLPFNDNNVDVDWETSSLRHWLNQDFYDHAFDENEKEAILFSNIENESRVITEILPTLIYLTNEYGGRYTNTTYSVQQDVFPDRDTRDKVYLLSLKDFDFNSFGYLRPTEFVRSKGSGKIFWWLRTPVHGKNSVFVGGGDKISSEGIPVTQKDVLVRPVIQVDLSLIVK